MPRTLKCQAKNPSACIDPMCPEKRGQAAQLASVTNFDDYAKAKEQQKKKHSFNKLVGWYKKVTNSTTSSTDSLTLLNQSTEDEKENLSSSVSEHNSPTPEVPQKLPAPTKVSKNTVKLEDFAVNLGNNVLPALTENQIANIDANFQGLKKLSTKKWETFLASESSKKINSSPCVRFVNNVPTVTIEGGNAGQIAGDYPIGDLTQNPETAVKLLQEDPNLNFINGECATLAWDLYETYPDDVVNVAEIWVKGDYDSMHVVAQLKDGSYVDGLGHWSTSGVLDAWSNMLDGKPEMEMRVGVPPKRKGAKFVLGIESTKVLGEYIKSLK